MIVNVSDISGAGEARRASSDLARRIGFTDEEVGRVSIVATEAATNIVKHAKAGAVIIQQVSVQGGTPGIEIIATDKGPGHHNIESCLRDGYSTAGTAGNGLGAIKRLSDYFDIYSARDVGTILLAQLWPTHQAPKFQRGEMQVGAVADPYPGEPVCGDGWACQGNSERSVLIVADGLGHGMVAYEASSYALKIFRREAGRRSPDIIDAIHAGIRHTRGCAVSVATVDWVRKVLNFCGAGNVSGCVVDAQRIKRSMVSMNGTAGFTMRKAKDFSYPFENGSILIMHSDGIETHWDLNTFPEIMLCHPSIIAAAIFAKHRRVRDDATVVVMKKSGGK